MSDFTMLNRIERVPELNRCSTKAIALWSMLHHALDRRGRVALGGVDYKTVLVRRLAVETSDRQWFYATLRELEEARLFTVEDDTFALVGHAGAGTEDVPKKPRGKRPIADLPPTSSVPTSDLPQTSVGPSADLLPTSDQPVADLLSGSPQNDSAQVPYIREEKSREEEKREEHTQQFVRGSGGYGWDPRRARDALSAKVFRRLWEGALPGQTWGGPSRGKGDAPDAIDRWAEREGVRAFCTAEEVLECSILRWSESEWATKERWPWPSFALHYAEHWRAEDLAVRFPGKHGRDPLRGAVA